MPDLIPHPDRPDEYLHAGQLVAQNRGTPVLEVVVDSRYAAGDGMAQSPVGVVSVQFDPDDQDHMALYAAAQV